MYGKLINFPEFQAKVMKAIESIKDLHVPFMLIALDWYKDNAQIFDDGKRGFYEDYKSEKYKNWKMKQVGFVYPMLKLNGSLSNSLLNPGADGAVRDIGKQTMTLGTNIEHGIYHQLGTKNMVARPFIINEYTKSDGRQIYGGRLKRYSRTLDTFVKKQIKKIYPKELKYGL